MSIFLKSQRRDRSKICVKSRSVHGKILFPVRTYDDRPIGELLGRDGCGGLI